LRLALVASNLNHGTGLVRKPVIGFLSRSPTITTVEAAPPPRSSVTPKFVSPSDPAAQWTGAMRGPAFFAYADNYLIDVKFGIIIDVEASRANERHQVVTRLPCQRAPTMPLGPSLPSP